MNKSVALKFMKAIARFNTLEADFSKVFGVQGYENTFDLVISDVVSTFMELMYPGYVDNRESDVCHDILFNLLLEDDLEVAYNQLLSYSDKMVY